MLPVMIPLTALQSALHSTVRYYVIHTMYMIRNTLSIPQFIFFSKNLWRIVEVRYLKCLLGITLHSGFEIWINEKKGPWGFDITQWLKNEFERWFLTLDLAVSIFVFHPLAPNHSFTGSANYLYPCERSGNQMVYVKKVFLTRKK